MTTIPEMPAEVAAVFAACPEPVRGRLLQIRRLIMDVAQGIDGATPVQETLKWGEAAYLPAAPRIGTTIRLGRPRSAPDNAAIFVSCRTTLIEEFRQKFGDQLTFQGDRAILIPADQPLPEAQIAHCLAATLTYHRRKR